MNFMNNQLTELLTNYGPIGAIWFDGYWDKDQDPTWDWNLGGQYELIHKLQPGCKIGNNHHSTPLPGEDFQMFERDLPGENTAGLSGQTISRLPLETCETMNDCTKRITSAFDFPRGEKSDPPLAPPIGNVVNEFLNVCSNAKNFRIERFTEL